jgi:predicted enzyme related to lactoylglutathione lyase
MKVSGEVVAGMLGLSGEDAQLPPYWLTYFMLDDVDAGFARVRELGGELLSEPHDSPYGRFAPVRDPQGAVFALIKSTTA